MRRLKGAGLGKFLKQFGKKHGKRLGRYALKRGKEIGHAEARKAANYALGALRGQKGGILGGHTRQRGKSKSQGSRWGALAAKLAPLAIQMLSK